MNWSREIIVIILSVALAAACGTTSEEPISTTTTTTTTVAATITGSLSDSGKLFFVSENLAPTVAEYKAFLKGGCQLKSGQSYCENGGLCQLNDGNVVECRCPSAYNGERCTERIQTSYQPTRVDRIEPLDDDDYDDEDE